MLRNETCPMYPDSLYNTSLSNTKEERLKSRQIRGFVYPDEALSPIFDISSHVIHEIKRNSKVTKSCNYIVSLKSHTSAQRIIC